MTLTFRARCITVIAAALILTPTAALATPGHDPVTICHKPGTPAEHEITVDRDALDKHLKHGDVVGSCEAVTIPTEPTPEPEPTDPPVIVEPTPTPEPTEEPTWEPTAPPTVEPSPEPVNPEPKPSDEPTPVQPSTPTSPNSPTLVPDSPSSDQPTTAPSPSSPVSPTTPTTPSPSSNPPTSTRPELAETGFNRELLALAASMIAAGAAIFLGSRWRQKP